MHFRTICRIVGLLLIIFSVTMIVPSLVSIIYKEDTGIAFIKTFICAQIIGFLFWAPNFKEKNELQTREGFLIVVLFWIVLGSVGALPFLFLKYPNLSITNAFFESFSGLTTTGATILFNLDKLPQSILFYRQMLQWFGGMGIIVLALAILPILGTGGMQLYKAEMPGPLKDNKMQPRIAETAKILWLIYVALTFLCALSLWFAGLPIIEAIGHSFSTVSIGGFSTHDENIGFYKNTNVEIIISIFLIISGCNYSLHFFAFSKKKINIYYKDMEFRIFFLIQITLIIISFLTLLKFSDDSTFNLDLFNKVFFQVISISTTAGFTSDKISNWPTYLPILLIISSCIGSCSGSTGGGIKVIRIILLYLHWSTELKKIIHPNAIYSIKINDYAISEKIIKNILCFILSYILILIISTLILISTGIDYFSSFSSVAATLNNVGIGFGVVENNFFNLNDFSKWILILTMLFGRLEIFTLLIILTPTFWRE
ncbi:trkH [Wigglesworthia glossinidia endosymbiont of Glossina brevipalpis]|uniref:Trk system potassium uptake protein n=1 Tax=Wigglesworthia glossinidia brevipalpis TaxID=36870 RepID=Q8D379_WIGBR|nr:trkH [Wigglesworthia glossinidia endosymbiont of Glossina brevipalpis]